MAQVNSLRTENKFKKTEIGKIPLDWEVSIVKNHAVVITKGTTPTTYGHSYTEEGVLFLRVENIGEQGKFVLEEVKYISEETDKFLSRSRLQSGDILFSIAGALGRVAVIPDFLLPANINQALALIRFKNTNLDRQYLKYVLQSDLIKAQVNLMAAQLAQANLNLQQVGDLKIPLPNKSEQKKIAEILSSLDEAIEKSREIIEKTKELKKGLIQELLTRGIGHKNFKKTEIGEIPGKWEVVKIGEICETVGGSTPSTNKKEYWDGNILWAVPTDISNLRGNVIFDTEKKITEKGLFSCAARLIPEGSILLTSRAPIGECVINMRPMATNQGFASLICKENAYNWFIFYKVKSIKKELERLGSEGTSKKISKKSIRAIKISLPPISEQKKIAEILLIADEEIEKEVTRKENLEIIKKGLMQGLLTGKVRGKI